MVFLGLGFEVASSRLGELGLWAPLELLIMLLWLLGLQGFQGIKGLGPEEPGKV